MTCDTEKDNDLRQLNINRKFFGSFERYLFFAVGLRQLLADEYFLLLYVPENGERMQVVRPANNSYHRKRMIKRVNEAKRYPSFYYALSHLWGLREDNRYLWNEIGNYVDNEKGQPMEPVSMRPEKRKPLLQLLRDHPDSYWWIDVLCARTDTPLDIMGDIYACSLECIAMIDCEPTLIPNIHTVFDAVVELLESCRNSAQELSTYQKGLYRTKGPQLIELVYTFFQNAVVELQGSRRKLAEELATYQKELYQTKGPQLIGLLDTFFQCEWWHRVWTLQEVVLPEGDVRFMAETDIHGLQSTNTITRNELLGFRRVLETYEELRPGIAHESTGFGTLQEACGRLRDMKLAMTYDYTDIRLTLHFTILSLCNSERRCYDACDYVYGVLGVMRMKIPRMSDPKEVWRHFLSKLDDSYPFVGGKRWLDRADEIDLREAENIGEVYKNLYDILTA